MRRRRWREPSSPSGLKPEPGRLGGVTCRSLELRAQPLLQRLTTPLSYVTQLGDEDGVVLDQDVRYGPVKLLDELLDELLVEPEIAPPGARRWYQSDPNHGPMTALRTPMMPLRSAPTRVSFRPPLDRQTVSRPPSTGISRVVPATPGSSRRRSLGDGNLPSDLRFLILSAGRRLQRARRDSNP